jgi:predicted transcriptional regulator
MYVKDIAVIAEVSKSTVERVIRELYPDLMVARKATRLNELQAVAVVKKLRKEAKMTIREISGVTRVSTETVRRIIKQLYPEKIVNGKPTTLTYEQSIAIVKHIRMPKSVADSIQFEPPQTPTQNEPQNVQVLQQNIQAEILVKALTLLDTISQRLAVLEQSSVKQIEMEQDYFSILAYCRKNSIKFTFSEAVSYGKCAVKKSKELGYEVRRVSDERFGTVGSYHINILKEVFAL